ncbi:MAG TPA: helix-turn-helix domain-containing protein [Microbacterium sp.]|nr:helix-turn-helix domain-containing protein [Microbacterium sp.]
MATERISERATRIVRGLLGKKGTTQEWLSNESGIPMRTLARRLHNTNPSPMTLDELAAVAEALGTDLVSILVAAREESASRVEQVA